MKTPEVFLKHNGVTIYHHYKQGYCQGRKLDFWYSTAKTEAAHEDRTFDIRTLGIHGTDYRDDTLTIHEAQKRWVSKVKTDLVLAIDEGRITQKGLAV